MRLPDNSSFRATNFLRLLSIPVLAGAALIGLAPGLATAASPQAAPKQNAGPAPAAAKIELPEDARPTAKNIDELELILKVPLEKASIAELERAIKAAVIAHPDQAANYVAALLQSKRKWTCPQVAQIVSAAILALGEKPSTKAVLSIVRVSVLLDEGCASAIVAAAVKAVPSLAMQIVATAVAVLRNPEQLVKEDGLSITLAEALANSAFGATPGLSRPGLSTAASNGMLALNPSGGGSTVGSGTSTNTPRPNGVGANNTPDPDPASP